MSEVKHYLEVPDDAEIVLPNPLKAMKQRNAKRREAIKAGHKARIDDAAKYVAKTTYQMAHRKHFS